MTCRLLACVASVSVWFEAKKDRGTGFSVLAAREMKREAALLLAPFFARSLPAKTSVSPRSLPLNCTETLAT